MHPNPSSLALFVAFTIKASWVAAFLIITSAFIIALVFIIASAYLDHILAVTVDQNHNLAIERISYLVIHNLVVNTFFAV
jgi:hypothetical protein